MSKRYEWNLVKSAEIDATDEPTDYVKGKWYKNQRYFSVNVLEVVVNGDKAEIVYHKGEIDWKSEGKSYFSYETGTGDVHCPCRFIIGDKPVVVVREVWHEGSGWNANKWEELRIETYNDARKLLEQVYEVSGATFLIGNLLYRLGFDSVKTPSGYIHKRPTPEELEEMNLQQAKEAGLRRLAAKKKHEEEKAAAFEEFKRLHKEGKLRLVVQIGDGYSPITTIRIPKPPEGTAWVFAWFEEGGSLTPNQACYTWNHKLSKKHLAVLGIEAKKTQNRWSIWFYAVDKEAIKDISVGIDYTEYMAAWH